MFRYLLATLVLAATLSFSGCIMGPLGGGQCHDCDGGGVHGGRVLDGSPGQAFRNWRKGLTCGSGCGEVYYDEWSSTPPDCVDPCPDFDGCGGGGCGGGCNDCSPCGCGVRNCRGGCGFRPLRAVKRIVVGLYGKRFCGDCGHGVDACSCDDPYSGYSGGACCDGCASSGGGGGGCASGNCGVTPSTTTQIASNFQMRDATANGRNSIARQQMLTRQAMNRATANSQGQIRTAQNRSASRTVRKPATAPPKFYRQSTQQPVGNRALRR